MPQCVLAPACAVWLLLGALLQVTISVKVAAVDQAASMLLAVLYCSQVHHPWPWALACLAVKACGSGAVPAAGLAVHGVAWE